MNREQRELYVIQLYKEGRTIRDIAGLVHMSFRDIGAITKSKRKKQNEKEDTFEEPKSDESRAFKMFSEGKSPIEVVIPLDFPAQFVEREY
jgi:hypothetical protein